MEGAGSIGMEGEARVRLPSGETLHLRPIRPDDEERLERLFHRLSPRTIYMRFFSPVARPSHRTLRYLSSVDHDGREAIVAVDGDDIVGVARYDRRAGTDEAEVAVLVEDAWQGRGLGRILTEHLAREARSHGVEAFTASMLGDNRRAIGLARTSAAAHLRFEDGEVEAVIPLRSA